jgi:hypothetical protein
LKEISGEKTVRDNEVEPQVVSEGDARMVARGGIEPPTRGFSVFGYDCLLSSRLI